MKVKVLGCGEAFDQVFGNNSFLLHAKNGPSLLFDCGYQIPPRLWAESNVHPHLDGIFFSHIHADHLFGIPAVLYRFIEEGRKKDLHIMGSKGIGRHIQRVCQLGYPGLWKKLSYAVIFKEVDQGQSFQWQGLQLQTAATLHSVKNLSLKITLPSGKSVGLSGDGKMTDQSRQLFASVQLLFHEVYSVSKDHPYHSNLEEILSFLGQSRVKRLLITHVGREERKSMERKVNSLRIPHLQLALPGQSFII